MNETDFQIAMKTFADLWPKAGEGLNREQLNVYRMAFGRATAEQVQSVLRDMAANSEKWPTPAAIRVRLLARKSSSTDKRESSPWDTFRAHWPEAGDWTDEQCELQSLKCEFDSAARTYGPLALATLYRWRCWQDALIRQGHREESLSGPHHSPEFRAEYERLGGLAEASAINEARGARR